MHINRKKATGLSVTIILSVLMVTSMILIPSTTAHTPPWDIVTHAYVAAFPNPVGVGQTAYVDMWLDKVIDGSDLSNDVRFENYKLVITAPDGTQETETFSTVSDPTSNQMYSFVPTQTGTYTFNFSFPGQEYTYTGLIVSFMGSAPSQYVGDTYLPSSASTTLTVQETQLESYPTTPLPTEYWSRPIYGLNSNWWAVSSNWLGNNAPGYSTMNGASFPGDAVGSQTSHVMWTKPIQAGGVVGGNNYEIQGDTYFDGSAYNNRFSNPIIINGRLYYREALSFGSANGGDSLCVDLQTGEEIWRSSTLPSFSFGLMYDVQDPNQHGVYPPILVSIAGYSFFAAAGPVTWMCYDASTGRFMFNATNIPSGTAIMGPDGEYLILSLVNLGNMTAPNYYLQQWNSSRFWTGQYSGSSTSPSVVPPITDGSDPLMFDFNVSLSDLNSIVGTPSIESAFLDNMVIVESGTYPSGGNNVFSGASQTPYTYSAYSIKQTSTVGNQLWKNTLSPPANNLTVSYSGADQTANGGAGVFAEYYTETMQYVGYSMATGQKIWGPTEPMDALAFFNLGYSGQGPTAAYGRLYSGGYSGVIYCYSMDDGSLMWSYGNGGPGNSTSGGLETARPYPTVIYAIGDDVVYTFTSEHTVTTPIYKGALARALNATTGEEIWTLSNDNNGGTGYGALADGYNVFFNGYDQQIYTVGRGPSQTTVSAPHAALNFGQPVVISGSVLDISAGASQKEQAGKLPNGVACSQDSSMADWMAYVYMQQPLPDDFAGVTVALSIIDQNGNCRSIGTAHTDASGTYRLTWLPDISGDYTVLATFEGTNGYYPSYAEDGFTVMEPEATENPTATPASVAETYFIPATAGLFALVIIVLIMVAVMMVKKR